MTADPIKSRSTATEAQIEKLLALLRRAPRHSHELRAAGISHPAGRILDLKKRGYAISSSRVTTVDSDGFSHVGVARYCLDREPTASATETQSPLPTEHGPVSQPEGAPA